MVERLNKQLLAGILPAELDFNEKPHDSYTIDPAKVQYQMFYKTFEFASKRFPQGLWYLPNFEKVIEANIPQLSPLEEWAQRQPSVIEEIDDSDECKDGEEEDERAVV